MRNRDLFDISHVFLLVPTKRWTGKVKNQNQIIAATIIISGAETPFVLFIIIF